MNGGIEHYPPPLRHLLASDTSVQHLMKKFPVNCDSIRWSWQQSVDKIMSGSQNFKKYTLRPTHTFFLIDIFISQKGKNVLEKLLFRKL